MLKLFGRVRHNDRYGLKYWLWANTRAMTTRGDNPCTDDYGVIEQLRNVYASLHGNDQKIVSVDVGGYIGVISLAMSHFGPKNHDIHTFEADDLNHSRILENLGNTNRSSVMVHKTAVADFEGVSEFRSFDDPGNNHLGAERSTPDVLVGVQEVSVTTLDIFTERANIEKIDVLKIDAEGFDFSVLTGATRLLSNGNIAVIFVETAESQEERNEMNNLLSSYGYSMAYINRNSSELIPATENSFKTANRAPLNMIAARPELARELGFGQ